MNSFKTTLSIILSVVTLSSGCTKSKNICWQAFDPGGVDVRGLIICDKSKKEAEDIYPQYWFYNSEEQKFCWKLTDTRGNILYARQIPASMTEKLSHRFHYVSSKIDCNTFCNWTILEKSKSKVTNLYTPTKLYHETLMSDTCNKLYVGRIIIYRETADSLITREFTEVEP